MRNIAGRESAGEIWREEKAREKYAGKRKRGKKYGGKRKRGKKYGGKRNRGNLKILKLLLV